MGYVYLPPTHPNIGSCAFHYHHILCLLFLHSSDLLTVVYLPSLPPSLSVPQVLLCQSYHQHVRLQCADYIQRHRDDFKEVCGRERERGREGRKMKERDREKGEAKEGGRESRCAG